MTWIIVLAAVGSFGSFATAFAAFTTGRRNEVRSKKADKQLNEIHVLVNSRLTTVIDRVEQLTQTLEHADVPVPNAPPVK